MDVKITIRKKKYDLTLSKKGGRNTCSFRSPWVALPLNLFFPTHFVLFPSALLIFFLIKDQSITHAPPICLFDIEITANKKFEQKLPNIYNTVYSRYLILKCTIFKASLVLL
jgi:hypothetical protein